MDKEKENDNIEAGMKSLGSELLEPVARLKASLLADINSAGNNTGLAEALPLFSGWATAASEELGSERTIAVLEASLMVGYLSPDLKSAIERYIPACVPLRVYTPVITKTQLHVLKDLMVLLGRQRVADLVMLQITTELLLSYWQPVSSAQNCN